MDTRVQAKVTVNSWRMRDSYCWCESSCVRRRMPAVTLGSEKKLTPFRASGCTSTPRRHAWRNGAIQNTGECAQQLHLCRHGSLIVPGTDDASRQQA